MNWQATQQPEGAPARASRNVTMDEVARLPRKRTIALLGLAGSGKTSYLHAMAAAAQPSWLRWVWPPASRHLAAQTGRPGEPLTATPRGVFRVSELDTLYRPWDALKRLGDVRFWFAPRRRLTIPEVSGEHVRDLADTEAELQSPEDREVDEKLRRFLDRTDMVLFLAGLKNTARSEDAVLKQDLIEGRIGDAAKSLRAIVTHMREGRGAGDPIFVTLLVTKRDLLRAFPGLDWVRLPKERSALWQLAEGPGRPGIKAMLPDTSGGVVRFEFNQVCDRFADDLAVQEAATVDYLACHAPRAHEALAHLARQRAVSLRILPCKPFGRECKTPDGRSAFPEAGQLDAALVWEPLDDLVERSYCSAARRMSRRRWSVVTVLLALAFLTGPLQSWIVNREIDARVAAGAPASAAALLEWNESPLNWWPGLLRSASTDHAYADAARWKRFRDGFEWTPEQRARMDRFIDARDPTHTLAAADAASARVDSLIGFVKGQSKAPGTVPPDGRASVADVPDADVDRELPELRADDGLLLSDVDADRLLRAIRGTWQSPVAEHGSNGWWLVSANLGQLAKWLGFEPGTDARRVVVRGNPPELLALLRSDLDHARACAVLRMQATKESIGEYRAIEGLAREAIRLADRPVLAALDARRDERLAAEWIPWTTAESARWDGAARLATFVKRLDAAVPADGLVADVRRREAARQFGRWLDWASESLGSSTRAPDAAALASAADGIDQFAQAMGDGWIGGRSALVDELRRLVTRANAAGRIVPGTELSRDDERVIRELFAGKAAAGPLRVELADGSASGRAVALDIGPMAARQSEQVIGALVARRDAIVSGIRAGRTGLAAEYRRVEELRRGLGASAESAPAGPDAALVDAATALAEVPMSPDAVRDSLAALLAQRGGVAQATPLIESVGASDARLRQAGAAVLAAIGGVPALSAGDRKALAEALLGGVRAWEGMPAPEAQALLVAGGKLGFDVTSLARREVGKVLEATAFDVDAADRMVRWYEVLVACGNAEAASALFAPLLRRTLDEIERGSIMVPGNGELLLVRLRGRGPRQVDQAADAIAKHREAIKRWNLVALPGDAGNGVVCYVAPREWTIEDLRRLNESQPVRLGDGPAFDAVGKPSCGECAEPNRGTLLGISKDDALQLARQAGLRLPTVAEWNAACRFQTDPAKDIDPTEDRIDAAALKALGDLARTPAGDELIGLRFGVREWCADGGQPMGGRSRNQPDGDDGKDNQYRGMRPAADAVPPALRALVHGG